jgi:hypothetical protein
MEPPIDRPPGVGRILERISARGASAQAAVAGGYAWAVTVAPTLWDGEATWVAKIAAIAAVTFLAIGVVGERLVRSARARTVSLWAFVLTSALAWLAAPFGVRPIHMDAMRALAGMLGWGLFALASAGPALGDGKAQTRVVDDAPLEARRRLAAGDAAYLASGALAALALELVGWRVVNPERALLVRLVAVAGGLGFIGVSAHLALARHGAKSSRKTKARLLRAAPAIAILVLLGLAGLFLPPSG